MICLLGVDLGTSGTKTVLFDAEGREVASQSVEYPLYQPQNGWAEQDPRDWWNAAVEHHPPACWRKAASIPAM